MKDKIISYTRKQLEEKLMFLKENLHSIQESANNETKSSVGDKYETGRAMAQLEIEKTMTQIGQVTTMLDQLTKIPTNRLDSVRLGALVKTDKGVFFISVGLGKVDIDGVGIIMISAEAPIAKALWGKKVGDEVVFNQIKQKIIEIE